MDWTNVIKQLAAIGLPVLGNLLGGPLGGAIANAIATAIGAAAPTPEAIGNTLATTDKDVAIQRLKSLEVQYVNQIQAEAEVAKAALIEVNQSWRAELTSGSTAGWFGKFQMAWRPFFAYELIIECAAMGVITFHELWTGDMTTVNAMMNFSGFLVWYYGMRFAVLGVYSAGRSWEKVSGLQAVSNTVIGDIVKKVGGALRK